MAAGRNHEKHRKSRTCPGGGIGRHRGLKIPRTFSPCGFESRPGYWRRRSHISDSNETPVLTGHSTAPISSRNSLSQPAVTKRGGFWGGRLSTRACRVLVVRIIHRWFPLSAAYRYPRYWSAPKTWCTVMNVGIGLDLAGETYTRSNRSTLESRLTKSVLADSHPTSQKHRERVRSRNRFRVQWKDLGAQK